MCKKLQEVINDYLNRGFGSMNKNDFEVFIFNELLINDSNCTNKSDFIISRYLKIPESKVKRLRYEAELVYGNRSNSYKDDFYDILKNRVYKTLSDDRIQFSINNKMLRLYLDDKLESFGSYADSSFNSSIVTITAQDLIMLIADFEEKNEILDTVKKSIHESEAILPNYWKKTVEDGMEAVVKDLGGKIAPNVTAFILDNLKRIRIRYNKN